MKGTWFLFPWHLKFYRNFTVRIQHMLPLPPPKIPPHVFSTRFSTRNPEPGVHLSMAGGSNRHLRRPQQVLLASQQATPEWEKNHGMPGCWEELQEFNPHHWVTPQAGPTRRWADHLPANISAWRRNNNPTRRLTTLQQTVSAASGKQCNACRFPALRSKCKERVDRWKPRGSFF